ncbi:DUF72 domain-containing protein [candidate division KSB1 bacterium]|nr:DUF72 domain-containing protein [candidate division KSB1 bacterium]
MSELRIGTCSWKYDSWRGLVYNPDSGDTYLQQYARKFNTVEIDQWFWSLFGTTRVLPKESMVKEYAASVPDNFKFTIKIPNSITLTHHYPKNKGDPLKANSDFFSKELTEQFIDKIRPLGSKIGMLMLQFEYLNKQKQASQAVFLDNFELFLSPLSRDFPLGVEIRNPNYLNKTFFEFLNRHQLCMVFLQGYYMPSIVSIYHKFENYFHNTTVIRLHGPNRSDIEKRSGKQWNKIWDAKDEELKGIVNIIKRLLRKNVDVYVNVNNHYEGSAPLTIEKIRDLLDVDGI